MVGDELTQLRIGCALFPGCSTIVGALPASVEGRLPAPAHRCRASSLPAAAGHAAVQLRLPGVAAEAAAGEDGLMFEPKNFFPVISLVFLLAAAIRWFKAMGKPDHAVRTWLLMAAIFGGVSWWLN